ncbi:MAG: hypothetical protein ACKVVP_05245 [Chloroflexota bacterium]
MATSILIGRPRSAPEFLGVIGRSSLFQAVTIVSVIAGVAWSTIGIFYDTNDDPSLRLTLEGHWVPDGRPEGRTLFLNAGLGHVLVRLYELVPGVPWYDGLLVGTIFIASIALVYALLFGRPLDLVLATGLGVLYLVPLLVRLQWTAVAGTATCAGLLLLLRSILTYPGTGFAWATAGAGLALALLGSLIRLDSAWSVLLLGGVFALPILLNESQHLSQYWRRAAALAGLTMLLITSGAVTDWSYYRDTPGWDTVHADGRYRTSVTEYLPRELRPMILPQVLAAAGWTESDHTVYENWMGTNPDVFGLARLAAASEARRLEMLEQYVPIELDRLRGTLNRFSNQFPVSLVFLPLLGLLWRSEPARAPALTLILGSVGLAGVLFNQLELALCMVAVMVMLPRHSDLGKYSVFVLTTILALAGTIGAVAKAPPWRVTAPLILLGVACVCFMAARGRMRPRWPMLVLVAGIAAVVVLPRLQTDYYTARNQLRERELVDARAWELQRVPEYTYIVAYEGGFDLFTYWQPFRLQEPPFRSIYLSWANPWPVVRNYLQANGLTDLPHALCTDPSLRWIGHSRVLPALERYIDEHYRMRVKYVLDPHFTHWAVYQCQVLGVEAGA